MSKNAILIHPDDNVAVATREIKAGEAVEGVDGKSLKAAADIPPSHKIAIVAIPQNNRIVKYGESIGLAKTDIKPGDWVHTHNVKGEDE